MKKNERGITLISLVVTIVILSILASLLVDASIKNSPAVETLNSIRNSYKNEQTKTEERVNKMTNGWEDIIL